MCTEVWSLFTGCHHKQYQNTCPCHIARRCHPNADMLLAEPVFLPAGPPAIPPGMFDCKKRVATRPSAGTCLQCQRKERANKLSSTSSASASASVSSSSSTRATPTATGSSSSFSSSNSSAHRIASPSPDPRALERVRQSFIMVAAKQRSVSQSPATTAAAADTPDQDRNQGRATSYGWGARPGTRTRE
ncbi:hypothetical protein F4775DRAFT_342631 [Biscogniauxia sp. FL1348]|nr:hypothetical protein F4775DRAFT_342631 [Biscogniauxia sp. FL1348]